MIFFKNIFFLFLNIIFKYFAYEVLKLIKKHQFIIFTVKIHLKKILYS
jgi:hypothetical protein